MSATDNVHQAHLGVGESLLEDDSLTAVLPAALQHRLEDWLALELTAERMAQDELALVGGYIANDTRSFVQDIKVGLQDWEQKAFEFLLRAADPAQKEWLEHHWWDKNEG